MYTKSIIQMALENMNISKQTKQSLSERLNDLMDEYIIEDAVFALKNNELYEVVEGFMAVDEEYETLDEAVANFDWKSPNSSIRITRNERFQIGHYYKFLTECGQSDHILDIDKLEDIR